MKQVTVPSKETRRHSVRLTVVITLFFVILVFGGLEIGVRVWQARKWGPHSMRSIALRDRFTAWRNNPAYGRVDRHINTQGFRRDADVPLEKPPNTVRIFITGGSVAYGWTGGWPQIDSTFDHLYDNQTISSYLEQMLNASYGAKHWEVINAAVVGYQLNLELAQTQSVLLRYKPDYIIYMNGHNDLLSLLRNTESTYDPYASTPTLAEFELLANPGSLRSLIFFAAVWLRENSALFHLMSDQFQNVEQRPAPAQGTVQLPETIQLSDLNAVERLQVANVQRQLTFFPRISRQINGILSVEGVKSIFLFEPELLLTRKRLTEVEKRLLAFQRKDPALVLYAFQNLYPEMAAKMAIAASADGFLFENLTDVFDGATEQMFTDDTHLTPEANRIVAARLEKFFTNTVN